MRFSDFKRELESGIEYGVYLFYGEETFFSRRGLSLLKRKFVTEENINFAAFNGEEEDGVISSIYMLPFMSEKRVTCAYEFYPSGQALEKLADFIKSPEGGVLIIINSKEYKPLIIEGVAQVECKKASKYDVARWIKAECAKFSVRAEGGAELLADYCKCDMLRVETETAKLIAYVGEGGAVTEEAVKELVVKDAEYEIYKMTDYIAKKKFDDAIKVVHDMLNKGETPVRLISSIYRYFRRLLHIKISDLSDEELMKALSFSPYPFKLAKEQAKSFSPKALKRAVDLLFDSETEVKNGNVGADDRLFISVFTIMTGDK